MSGMQNHTTQRSAKRSEKHTLQTPHDEEYGIHLFSTTRLMVETLVNVKENFWP